MILIVFQCRMLLIAFFIFTSLSKKFNLCRMKHRHISQIATLCTNEFFDLTSMSRSALKQERQWICSHLEKNIAAKNMAFFVVTGPTFDEPADEPASSADEDNDKKATIVGFVEVALTSEASQILMKDGLVYRSLRPKITSLVIDPAHRGNGLGRTLVNTCAAQSTKWIGCSELLLEVRDDNTGARSFYEKLGFHTCPNASRALCDGNAQNNVQMYFRSG